MLQTPPSLVAGTRNGLSCKAIGLVGALALLASCGPAPVTQGMNDPNEVANRQAHDFNRVADRILLRPASSVYGGILPEPVKRGVANFAANLDVPGDVVNNVAQGRVGFAGQNLVRFGINSTVGLLGLVDVASAVGVPGKPTDFGETLHVWGVEEGAYAELPLIGPTTERDLVGKIVDVALNPVRLALDSSESYITTSASIASALGARSRFASTIDSVLYESADSYAQTRLLYLQNRRFSLGQTAGDETFEDPYEDPYAQ